MAAVFHFPPSEIWEMDLEELNFWRDGLEYVAEKNISAMNKMEGF